MSLQTRSIGPALFAMGALLLSTHDANAGAVTTSDVSGSPGGTVGVNFDFNFGASADGGTSVTSFVNDLSYDPTQLTFLGESVAGQFTPFGTDAAIGLDPSSNGLNGINATAGDITATWFGFDATLTTLTPLQLSGAVDVTYLFALPASAGSITSVTESLSYSDADLNSFGPISATANVSTVSVPEPASYALILVGLGMMLVFGRRRGLTAK